MKQITSVIKEANFDKICQFSSIALLGKRRTGKTTWAKYILQSFKNKCGKFVVICGNKDNQVEWSEVVSPLFIYDKDVSICKLQEIRSYQDNKCSGYNVRKKKIPVSAAVTIIFDDCGADRSFMHSKIMKDLLSNGRHYGMFIIILAQYLNQMHAVNRDQLDYLGVLFTNNLNNIKKIYNEYCNLCELDVFHCILSYCTTNNGLCWIDNTQTPDKPGDFVFYKNIPWPIKFNNIQFDSVRQFAKSNYFSQKKKI